MTTRSDSGPLAPGSFPSVGTHTRVQICPFLPLCSFHFSKSCHPKLGSATAGRWPIKDNPRLSPTVANLTLFSQLGIENPLPFYSLEHKTRFIEQGNLRMIH